MGAGKVQRGEEFKDDFRRALPGELVQRLSRISPWRSAWSVPQEFLAIGALVAAALHRLHRELASRELLAGAEVVPFGATLGKIFADHVPAGA